MAVAGVTEMSNYITIGNAISATVAPAFVKGTCMTALMHVEDLPFGASTKKLPLDGSLTAAAVAESTAAAIDTNGELTQTSVTATPGKVFVSSGLSVEAQDLLGASLADLGTKAGNAIARYVDADALALLGGFSTVVVSSSVLTIDDLMLGQYNIYNSNCPDQNVMLAAVLPPKQLYNIKKELVQGGASNWQNPERLAVLNGLPQTNCFVGSIPGLANVYSTTGHATTGGDTISGIFHPKWALAGVFAPAPVTWVTKRGAEGFYVEVATYFLYDVLEYNDLAGVELNADT